MTSLLALLLPQLLGGMVGEPDAIIDRLKKAEAVGIGEVTLLTAAATARGNYADFARHVIERY